MAVIDIGSVPFDYVERGAGAPVVLVHGSASDRRTWDGQLTALSERFRVIAYSRRYHWPNPPIGEEDDYSMLEHVEDLAAFIGALDLAPAHLVGHSYGAFVSLLLAMREPSLVRSLVLAEPPALTLFTSNAPKPSELMRLMLTRPRTAMAIMKFGATGVAPATAAVKKGDDHKALQVFGAAVLGREGFRGLSAERLEQARANFIGAELVGSGFAPLVDADVRAVRRPALLITGQHSPSLFHRLADRLHELLPQADRIELPGASHIMHEDNAPAWRAAVLSFLGSAATTAHDPAKERLDEMSR